MSYMPLTPLVPKGRALGIRKHRREIISFCRGHLAHCKCSRTVVIREIPKISTGKVQKFRVRQMAQGMI